jgi:nucleotide-binding universal stress UspA family protein
LKFENILVCLDGSAAGEAIIPHMAALAGRFGSKVVLLKVNILPTLLANLGKAEIEPDDSSESDDSEEDTSYHLERIAGPLRKEGLDVECVTITGPLEESIITFARTFGVGLIAMSTRDRGILSRLVSRSTTDFVLRKSGIPVLAICPDNVPSQNKKPEVSDLIVS